MVAKYFRYTAVSFSAPRIIRRDKFDAWLAEKIRAAGIQIREGVTVKNVIPDKDGVTIETVRGHLNVVKQPIVEQVSAWQLRGVRAV